MWLQRTITESFRSRCRRVSEQCVAPIIPVPRRQSSSQCMGKSVFPSSEICTGHCMAAFRPNCNTYMHISICYSS